MAMVCRDVKFNEDKAMRCSLERELLLHGEEEILAPKEETQDDVETPHVDEQRVEAPTHYIEIREYQDTQLVFL